MKKNDGDGDDDEEEEEEELELWRLQEPKHSMIWTETP
jgi:hypothetical protein